MYMYLLPLRLLLPPRLPSLPRLLLAARLLPPPRLLLLAAAAAFAPPKAAAAVRLVPLPILSPLLAMMLRFRRRRRINMSKPCIKKQSSADICGEKFRGDSYLGESPWGDTFGKYASLLNEFRRNPP